MRDPPRTAPLPFQEFGGEASHGGISLSGGGSAGGALRCTVTGVSRMFAGGALSGGGFFALCTVHFTTPSRLRCSMIMGASAVLELASPLALASPLLALASPLCACIGISTASIASTCLSRDCLVQVWPAKAGQSKCWPTLACLGQVWSAKAGQSQPWPTSGDRRSVHLYDLS